MDGHSKQSQYQVVSIDMLPDDVLVEIFDVFVKEAIEDQDYIYDSEEEAWQSLVHVCRRWRSIVFASPRRLNLRLACSSSTPAGDVLDIWPSLPLLVRGAVGDLSEGIRSDNIIAALEHRDRVCHIVLEIPSLPSQNFWAAMRGPFPELTILHLSSDVTLPVVPDSFLGGFAPRLQDLSLYDIPILGLPKLLMTATHLVILHLLHIPHSGYISPEMMATCLSASTSLEQLHLEFQSSQSRPDRKDRFPPPPTRSVLPALTWISFSGYSEYMEYLVARIDAPLLDRFSISFWNQLAYDTPQLVQFISRTPKLKAPDEAKIFFSSDGVQFSAQSSTVRKKSPKGGIFCTLSNQQFSFLARARCSSFLPLSTVKTLYIVDTECDRIDRLEPWHCDIENNKWLFRPFISVKTLYLCSQFAPCIGPVLEEFVDEGVPEALPALQNVYIRWFNSSRSTKKAIRSFSSARQLYGHPITFHSWIYCRNMQGG